MFMLFIGLIGSEKTVHPRWWFPLFHVFGPGFFPLHAIVKEYLKEQNGKWSGTQKLEREISSNDLDTPKAYLFTRRNISQRDNFKRQSSFMLRGDFV